MSRRFTRVRSPEDTTARESRPARRTESRIRAVRTKRVTVTMAAAILVLFMSACGVNAVDTRAPEPVTAVTATPGVGLITVVWEDNSTFETGFMVSRKTLSPTKAATALPDTGSDDGSWKVLATVVADVTTYEDRDLTLGAHYRYSVTATNDGTDATPVEPEAPEAVEVMNGAPIAEARDVVVADDGTVENVLAGSDPEGAELAFTVVVAPEQGTLTGTVPALVYAPNPDFRGSDAFTFRVNDGADDSAVATVSVEVQPENDVPVAEGQSLSMDEDHVLSITLAGTDTEAGTLSFSIVDGDSIRVSLFTVRSALGASANVVSNGQFSYDPTGVAALSACGVHEDTFEYTVEDSTGLAIQGTVSVVGNCPPTDISLSSTHIDETEPAGSTVGTFSTTDLDPGDTHTYGLVAGPGDWDNSVFSIDGSSLVANQSFDYETKTSYQIRVRTDDGRGGTYEEAFVIDVGNQLPPAHETGMAWPAGSTTVSYSGNTTGQDDDFQGDSSADVIYRMLTDVGTNPDFTFDTEISGYDSVLHLLDEDGRYLALNDDSYGTATGAKITYPIVPGKTYYIVVEAYAGAEGSFTLRVQN